MDMDVGNQETAVEKSCLELKEEC